MPITSPVDFISGPSAELTRVSFPVENTGALTATSGSGGTSPVAQPMAARGCPRMAWVAISTIGTPVTLLMNGTVRDARGLTSRTWARPRQMTNWILQRPRTGRARAIAMVASTIWRDISSPRWGGG